MIYSVGLIIQQLRKSRGWTLRQLAEQVGIHYAYLSQIERDKVTPSGLLLDRLAAAFGLTQQQLMREAKGGLPRPKKLRQASTSRLTRLEREVRECLAQFYLEEAKGGKDFYHSGWIAHSRLKEIIGEFDPSRILQNMSRFGLIQTKREGEALYIRLNPEHKENSRALGEARELDSYRQAIEEDNALEGKAMPHVHKLGQLIYTEENDSFHYVVIPGLSEMLLRANIRLDEELLEGLTKSSIYYHEYYTRSSSFLPWVAAYTSMVLQRNSRYAGAGQIKEILQDVKDFYEQRHIGMVVKQLAIGERNYLGVGQYLFKALGLEYLKAFECWALETLAFCWVAYMYLDSLPSRLGVFSHTVEGEIKGLAQPIVKFALQLIAKGKTAEDFQQALIEPIEKLWENAEDNEVISLGRLQDTVQFPWGL